MAEIAKINDPKGHKTFLVIDPSASHLAYVIIDVDFDKKDAGILSAGMMWTKTSYSKGQRFSYIRKGIQTLLNVLPLVDIVYTEAFFANPKQMQGSAVIPVVNGLIELSCVEVSREPIQYEEIPPTSWRSILGIKPVINRVFEGGKFKNKRDYKTPTLQLVELTLGKLPEQVMSNVTSKLRDTPHDLSDALAIGLAILKEHGIEKVEFFGNTWHNKDIIDQLRSNV